MKSLYEYQELQTRWASPENPSGAPGAAHRQDDGRKRRAWVPLSAGGRLTLAECSGHAGTVRRIWLTITDRQPEVLRGLRVRMYWDGAAAPAVDAPLGDFFCHGAGRMTRFENECFASPEGRSFLSFVPMPFRTAMRLELLNESGRDVAKVFYDVDFTVGDRHGPEMLYLHCHWRRERPTILGRDFTVLPQVTGRGRLLGVLMSVITDTATWGKTWWGEGEMKIYLDGDTTHPTLCGTGTEDWIGTGWGQGQFVQGFQGCPVADGNVFGFYRFHVPDPVFFSRGIRAVMQQIGNADVHHVVDFQRRGIRLTHGGSEIDLAAWIARRRGGLFERSDDVAACTWFYLDRAENGLPELVPVAERVAGSALPGWPSVMGTAEPQAGLQLLDLRPIANRALRGGGSAAGWLGLAAGPGREYWPHIPQGVLIAGELPFRIIGDAADDHPRSLLALAGREHLSEQPRSSAALALPAGLRRLWVLQTAGWLRSPLGAVIWNYDLHLANGEIRSIPVQAGVDVGDWVGQSAHRPAISVFDESLRDLVNLWVQCLDLPGDQPTVAVSVRSAGLSEVPLILAMTGDAG